MNEIVETASISFRAKTLKNFLEKLQRKTYSNPLLDITDLAGVRIVCLYRDDLQIIENIITNEFSIHEKVDKLNDKSINQFGYGAIHFLVSLGRGATGARYDDLNSLVCEIQIRTVLQDAWAIIQHHLVYKHENEVPNVIQRKLNGLAGLLETADDQYQQVRKERDAYIEVVKKSKNIESNFLQNELNLDSLKEYLLWKMPDNILEDFDGQLAMIYKDWDSTKYSSLLEIDNMINLTHAVRIELAKKLIYYSKHDKRVQKQRKPSAAFEFAWAASLLDPKLMSATGMPKDWREELSKHTEKFAGKI